jgi:hypothetical protein
MVDHEVQDHLQSLGMGCGDEAGEIGPSTKMRVNGFWLGEPIAVIAPRVTDLAHLPIDRGNPDRGGSRRFDVVELAGQPDQVATMEPAVVVLVRTRQVVRRGAIVEPI